MYVQSERTTATRLRDRMSYERATGDAILDEAYHCQLGFTVDGEPRILPTLHVRIDDVLYLHGSTGSRPLLAARGEEGLAICVTVTHLDGLVLARSQFHHSANYRSVVAHGRAHLVTDATEKARVMTALVDKVARGRAAQTRPPTARELAETAVLALPLREVSVRARVGGVNDDEADLDLPVWAGVVPLRLVPGRPEPDAGVTAPLPDYLRPAHSPWLTAPRLTGRHVVLAQLELCHVDGLFAAVADEEVYRWIPRPRPHSVEAMAAEIRDALRHQDRGLRVPFVQLDAATGEVIGTTSYYAIDETQRQLAIGSTMVSRRFWRTGVNTEAKLLLLTHAFETLGAVRVEWHTDSLNERSQRAIERLGATREGVQRRHRQRADGSWRDTVLYSMTDLEWPTAKARLTSMLRDPDPSDEKSLPVAAPAA